MKNENLYVHMFDTFEMYYNGKSVQLSRGNTTKEIQLMMILLYAGSEGIRRKDLISSLYGKEDLTEAAGRLRAVVFRLRKYMDMMDMPVSFEIVIKSGSYYIIPSEPVTMDVTIFEQLVLKAREDEENRVELLKEACRMYRGEFLAELKGEEWVVMESVRYQELYAEALNGISEPMKDAGEYEELLSLVATAVKLYPFEEWQVIQIECLIKLKRLEEAIEVYNHTAAYLQEELGITPSERMVDLYQHMGSQIELKPDQVVEINETLREDEDRAGAYYCTFLSFQDCFRIVSRLMERNGQSAYLMLCTITDSKGDPMSGGKRLPVLADRLKGAMQSTLRRGDFFTRYSQSQFLVFLSGISQENCSLTENRINKKFWNGVVPKKNCLQFTVDNVSKMSQEQKMQVFAKSSDWVDE